MDDPNDELNREPTPEEEKEAEQTLLFTLAQQVELIWRRSRPKAVAQIEAEGEPPKLADNDARREWVVLPDEGPADELKDW